MPDRWRCGVDVEPVLVLEEEGRRTVPVDLTNKASVQVGQDELQSMFVICGEFLEHQIVKRTWLQRVISVFDLLLAGWAPRRPKPEKARQLQRVFSAV